MIKIETKKELFSSSLDEIEKIILQLLKDAKDAKEYLKDQNSSDERNLNAVMGTLLGISVQIQKIEEIKNALKTVNEL